MDDKHPVRRKRDDNPYTLNIEDGKHYISFTDGQGIYHHFEISHKLYQQFNEFELNDKAMLNEEERHYSSHEFSEENLNFEKSIEDIVLEKFELTHLKEAIAILPKIQQNRLRKYFLEGKTFQEIADEENCNYQPIQRSVYRAIEKIKNFLKNRGVF